MGYDKRNLIIEGEGKIQRKLNNRGIGPVITLYEEGLINNAEIGREIICPMERAVMSINEPKEALEVLKQTLEKLRKEA